MQPAPTHSISNRNGFTATYAMVHSLARRRNTKLCPEPLVTKSVWFLGRAKKKKRQLNARKRPVQTSRSCVTALLTWEGMLGMKREASENTDAPPRTAAHPEAASLFSLCITRSPCLNRKPHKGFSSHFENMWALKSESTRKLLLRRPETEFTAPYATRLVPWGDQSACFERGSFA
jgi:hypothetical protein